MRATADLLRLELVRRYGRYGLPWFEDRAELVGRLAFALTAQEPDPCARRAMVARWCGEAFPRLEG